MYSWSYYAKLPNLKLKTRPKQLLGYLPLDMAPDRADNTGTGTAVLTVLELKGINLWNIKMSTIIGLTISQVEVT
jgi:hypothetical protein